MSERIGRVLEATISRLDSGEMATNAELFITAFPMLSTDEREELMTTLVRAVAVYNGYEPDFEEGDKITGMLFSTALIAIMIGAQMRDMSMAGTL